MRALILAALCGLAAASGISETIYPPPLADGWKHDDDAAICDGPASMLIALKEQNLDEIRPQGRQNEQFEVLHLRTPKN